MKDSVRTFVAIELPESLRNSLGGPDVLAAGQGDRIKWQSAANIHITLKFLGDTPSDKIDSVKESLSDAVKGVLPFRIKVKGIGLFPTKAFPRVIWAGIEYGPGHEDIKKIHLRIEENLRRIEFLKGKEKEKAPYTPHITIGRINALGDTENFFRAVSSREDYVFGESEVDCIALVKSVLTKEGAVYETLSRHQFIA